MKPVCQGRSAELDPLLYHALVLSVEGEVVDPDSYNKRTGVSRA